MDSKIIPTLQYKYTCELCLYNTNNSFQYNKHILTSKHKNNNNDSKKLIKREYKYTCSFCNFYTNNTCHFNNHVLTTKHIKNEKDSKLQISSEKMYLCVCGKLYKYDSGYYRHKKNCTYIPPVETPVTKEKTELEHNQTYEPDNKWFEIIQMLIKENQETRNLVLTQHNTLIELVKNQQPTTNNSHNNNTNYNINMFLSEKCKDAKNMTEFIETLKNKADMFQIEETGYVDGISKLFIDELKSMEVTKRPLHCTDERRNTFYVHNNNAWNKDQNLNDTKRAINCVSHTNLQQCLAWSTNEPAKEADREEHITRSIRLCKEANSSSEDAKVDKIIKNISKEIPLNKQLINEL